MVLQHEKSIASIRYTKASDHQLHGLLQYPLNSSMIFEVGPPVTVKYSRYIYIYIIIIITIIIIMIIYYHYYNLHIVHRP